MTVWLPTAEQRVDRDECEPLRFESRTGVYFPTVCGPCHEGFSLWDEAIKTVALEAVRGAPVVLATDARSLLIRVRSNHVALGTLAHMLTSRFEPGGSVFETIARDIVRGVDPSEPYRLYLYLWPYGCDPAVVILHDFVAPQPVDGRRLVVGSLIEFGPLTFFVSEGPLAGLRGFDILDAVRNGGEHIIVNYLPRVDPRWPFTTWFMAGRNGVDHVFANPPETYPPV